LNVLAIEDHALFREGLRQLLQKLAPDVRVSEADSAASALRALEAEGAELDLVLLDLGVPGAGPFELLGACRKLAPEVPVAVLSASEDRFEIERALGLGAQAYLFKSSSNAVILDALARVLAGELVAPGLSRDSMRRASTPGGAPTLTERQLAVLERVARGASNKEIAAELELAENTIKVHLANIYRVLDVTTRTAAVRKAARAGLIRHE
jgi:DNA-binding NarL/FixJ family response regulator